jgi:ribonucleoside-diphosphate reductase alpha chain
MIVDGAWGNGEPGIIFLDRMNNDSPYLYSNQIVESVNPCGEQPLPKNGACNLGSIDLSKFVEFGMIDRNKLELASRIAVRFLDAVIDAGSFPTKDIADWVKSNRPVGVGVMGVADMLLSMGIAYGSDESLSIVGRVMKFISDVCDHESEELGRESGVPEACKHLPIPRRNVTTTSIAPTGTISLIAGCSNGIEPIFSEFTMREDKTGTYKIYHPMAHEPHFRCAVTGNGGVEVTWQEHVKMQNEVQKYVNSGVSKTINFPNSATKEEVASAFMMAYDMGNVKGMTVYRNGSRQLEVLSPKKINKDKKCPECDGNLVKEGGCTHCDKCEYSFCEVS